MNYFAWGSKAENTEIEQLQDFKKLFASEFPETQIVIKLREAEYYFDEYFKINKASFPKISLHSSNKAEAAETEAPLAYVPYRNTQFAILLASICEADNMENVDMLFGLNLSEGMVFMDNSEGWLESISNTIKYGGKDSKLTYTYNVIAPYFARTKTNMLLEFKKEFGEIIYERLLNLSKSCYYPDDEGQPCGKCGSCILREKAERKIEEKGKIND
jgi:7-cyano-7-deazaguanine synthase